MLGAWRRRQREELELLRESKFDDGNRLGTTYEDRFDQAVIDFSAAARQQIVGRFNS